MTMAVEFAYLLKNVVFAVSDFYTVLTIWLK